MGNLAYVLNIGKHLKNIRQNRELSLDEAAEMTGVSKPMLGQIERGQSSPTITTLWKIATGLKVPLSSFLQETRLFSDYGLTMNFEQYVLVGSTVRSYLSWLKDDGKLSAAFEDNMLLWNAVEK